MILHQGGNRIYLRLRFGAVSLKRAIKPSLSILNYIGMFLVNS